MHRNQVKQLVERLIADSLVRAMGELDVEVFESLNICKRDGQGVF